MGHRPITNAAGYLLREILQEARPIRGVDDLGMELHAIQCPLHIGDCRKWSPVCCGNHLEAGRQVADPIAVAHPDLVPAANRPNALKQRIVIHNINIGAAEFAML